LAERLDSGGTRGEPSSDLIKLDSSITSIPNHVELLPTPEELRAARIARTLKIAATVVILALLAWAAHAFLRQRSRAEAIAEALRHGRSADFEEATALTDDPGTLGWLYGASALTRAEAELPPATLEAIRRGADEAGSRDGKLAHVYVTLLGGDAEAAHGEAERLELAGDYAAEMIFVQSLAAEAAGKLDLAVARASVARQLRPDSTRYLARWAVALVRAGHPEDALARLEGAEAGAPDLALARARAELAKLGDPAAALAAAEAVLAAEASTEAERGWAQLVKAVARARVGDRQGASAAADEARAKAPVLDELFRLELAEVLLSVGRVDDAAAALGEGDPATSTELARRLAVRGHIALARDRVDEAAAFLGRTPSAPERALLEGAVAEAKGALDRAAAVYDAASRAPRTRAAALARLAEVELAREQPASAVQKAAALLEAWPSHPDYVPIAVDAYAAAGDLAHARAVLEAAEAAHPDDLRLKVARGRLHLAAREWTKALEVLTAAAARAPDESGVQIDLGDAARESGHADQASAAYARALELRPGAVRALLGLLELALDRWDLDAAGQTLARIDELVRSSDDLRLLELRARYLVASGAGDAGAEALRDALRKNRHEGYLRLALGELYLQAESYGQAARFFELAARLDGVDPREALVGAALAQALNRRRSPAERTLEQAAEADAEASPRPTRTPEALAALEARAAVAEGRLELLQDHGAAARRLAARALARMPESGDALLLSAVLAADQASTPPVDAWRKASRGRPRQPLAAAQLALALGANEEGCAAGRAYLRAAPRGAQASAVRELVRGCH
jgi:predicted Zn-dependent protease